MRFVSLAALLFVLSGLFAEDLKQEPNTWVKRSPLPEAPLSPMLGYEGSFGYDPIAKRLIRWAGHNQGGGGEQNAETWTFDPVTARWELKEPNISPPGVCCAQQNVFDLTGGRFLRFRAFSGSHGWQWYREIYHNNGTVWSYDLSRNTWRNNRPVPEPAMGPLRCAAWDTHHQVVVIFGGEGSSEGTLVYDPYINVWTRMNPGPQPAFRSAGNMAYDVKHKRHILFGSQFSDDPHTWAYDLTANKWIDLKPKVMPPTDKNDAVLSYDERNDVVVANVKVAGEKKGDDETSSHYETWIYDSGKNTWRAAKPAVEPPGGGNRRRIMAYVPDQNVVLMENYVNPPQKIPGVDREQQIWSFRAGAAPADKGLPAPQGVVIKITGKGAELRWTPVPGAERYIVTRWNGEQSWKAKPVGLGAVQEPHMTVPLAKGVKASFTVRAENAAGASGPSQRVRTQPPLVEDVIASVKSATHVKIAWPRANDDLARYHVERAVVEVFTDDEIERLRKDTPPLAEASVGAVKAIGPFQQITKEPLRATTWEDTTIDLTKPAGIEGNRSTMKKFSNDQLAKDGKAYRFAVYAYRVRAVNAAGVPSGDGPYTLTIPSSPQWVFSKEAGNDCHIKWAKNPEEGLLGYRVYRMESPRVNGPGQKTTRLNAKPTAEPAFVDEKIGTLTRRYWVVAVDALGQEGFVSAPTWHYREYRR
jgi:hypothetical protein